MPLGRGRRVGVEGRDVQAMRISACNALSRTEDHPSYVGPKVPRELSKCDLVATFELLTKVFWASDEKIDLTALCAALKTKLGLADSKKLPASMSCCVQLLTTNGKSCRGIHSIPTHSCPSGFHPLRRTVPFTFVGEAHAEKDERLGLGRTGTTCYCEPLILDS